MKDKNLPTQGGSYVIKKGKLTQTRKPNQQPMNEMKEEK